MNRNAQLGQIHIAKKDLGMDDETYRDFLFLHTKKSSAADLDMHARFKLIQAFKNAGWKSKRSRQTSMNIYKKSTSRLMIALWRELHNEGKIKDKRASAMEAWIANQTNKPGQQIPKQKHPDSLSKKQTNEMIERLKRWQNREGE